MIERWPGRRARIEPERVVRHDAKFTHPKRGRVYNNSYGQLPRG